MSKSEMPEAGLLARIALLEKENLSLKSEKVFCKVGDSGWIIVYPPGRKRPVTLPVESWHYVFDNKSQIIDLMESQKDVIAENLRKKVYKDRGVTVKAESEPAVIRTDDHDS